MKTKQEALSAVAKFASDVRIIIMQSDDGIKIAGLVDKAKDAAILLYKRADDPDEFILRAFEREANERFRGETPQQLAEIVIAKANAVRDIRAKVDGLESRFKTAVAMAQDDASAIATFKGGRSLAIRELSQLGIPLEVLNSL